MSGADELTRLYELRTPIAGSELADSLARTKTALASLPDHGEEKINARGYYFAHGLTWVVEVPKGDKRKDMTVTMHYGHIKGTKGKDGEGIDFWMDPEHIDLELFFVINQRNTDGTGFDEHKVLVGCPSEEKAREKYLENYPTGLGEKLLGSVKAMTLPDFKNWLRDADKEKKAREVCPDGECCPHCQARLERGDDGNCNRCGKPWPAKKAKKPPYTIAVDLDGTIAEQEEPFDIKSIGEPRKDAKKWLKAFRAVGARIIIFTVRGDKELVSAWLRKHDMPYDFINENPDQPPDSSGKVFAHAYWDDRAHNAVDLDEHGPSLVDLARGHKKSAADMPMRILTAARLAHTLSQE